MTEKWIVIDAHNHYMPEEVTKLACTADGLFPKT
jgi:hypothetical protein